MSDVTLEHPGGSLPLTVKPATEGPAGIEVPKLLASTGMVTLDPGFVNTASCESAITYIDGDAGVLRYRGYPIEELAEKASFLEVSWLLIYGELPTADELNGWKAKIRKHTMLHEDFREFFGGFPTDAHPMAGAVVGRERAVDLLPGQPGPVRRRARRDVDGAPHGQDADHRGVRPQEVGRAAVPVPRQHARATSTTSCA
jgi:hypothetical protein